MTEGGAWHPTNLTRMHFFRNGRSLCPSRFVLNRATHACDDNEAFDPEYAADTCQKCVSARRREIQGAADYYEIIDLHLDARSSEVPA